MTSPLGFKARLDPWLACFVTCMPWIPEIHLWCDTCWLCRGQHGGQSHSLHATYVAEVGKLTRSRSAFILFWYHVTMLVNEKAAQPCDSVTNCLSDVWEIVYLGVGQFVTKWSIYHDLEIENLTSELPLSYNNNWGFTSMDRWIRKNDVHRFSLHDMKVWQGVYPRWGTPRLNLAVVPPIWTWPGYPPNRCGQTENITFPHPLDAVSN